MKAVDVMAAFFRDDEYYHCDVYAKVLSLSKKHVVS